MHLIDNIGHYEWDNNQSFYFLSVLITELPKRSKSDHTVRVSLDEHTDALLYSIMYNNKNKTTVGIAIYQERLVLTLYERCAPDPAGGITPEVIQKKLEFNMTQLEEVLDEMVHHLDKENMYSMGTVKKVKVFAAPKPLEPWSYAGGRIEVMQSDNKGVYLKVESIKHTYFIPHNKLKGRNNYPAVRKYVVFNENEEFDFFNSEEFGHYFTAKHAH